MSGRELERERDLEREREVERADKNEENAKRELCIKNVRDREIYRKTHASYCVRKILKDKER